MGALRSLKMRDLSKEASNLAWSSRARSTVGAT
jgi:hypothetical protein